MSTLSAAAPHSSSAGQAKTGTCLGEVDVSPRVLAPGTMLGLAGGAAVSRSARTVHLDAAACRAGSPQFALPCPTETLAQSYGDQSLPGLASVGATRVSVAQISRASEPWVTQVVAEGTPAFGTAVAGWLKGCGGTEETATDTGPSRVVLHRPGRVVLALTAPGGAQVLQAPDDRTMSALVGLVQR